MRHEKAELLLRIALRMQGTAEGLSLEDIQQSCDPPVSRRTAERLRDALLRVFPQIEEISGSPKKRWRLRPGTLNGMAQPSSEELADLRAMAASAKRRGLPHAKNLDSLALKLEAALKKSRLIAPDLEGLSEADGWAMRPEPRVRVDQDVFATLRFALLACRKVRLTYRYRASRAMGYDTVHPYGFLYGHRHYLVAWSENDWAEDFRNFSLSDIAEAKLLDESFPRDPEFSLARYAERSFGVFQEEPADIVWRFLPDVAVAAREFQFHPSQTTEDLADGSHLVRFRAGGFMEMAWHLVTWGDRVEVLEPADFWSRARKAGFRLPKTRQRRVKS